MTTVAGSYDPAFDFAEANLIEKAPLGGSCERGLPSRRSPYLVPTRGWVGVVDAARAARSLAEGLKEAKQFFGTQRLLHRHSAFSHAAHKMGIEPEAVGCIIENVQ
jgi:hypothetical protein